MDADTLLRVDTISKSFPGVKALTDVSFDVRVGEVHALVGENGAGKSTLMKILAGVYKPDSGHVYWLGQPVNFQRPADAQTIGISIIYQEFNLLPDLTVAENILLKREPRNWLGVVNWRQLNERAQDVLKVVEADISPHTMVYQLTIAQQQIVEIVKAIATDASLIIMDEPTAALNPAEVEQLYKLVNNLKQRDTSVIFISHRLEEVLAISDRVTVLKDGNLVQTQSSEGLTREAIVRQMVGRSLNDIFPPRSQRTQDVPIIDVRAITTPHLNEVSLQLYPGEVLGVAGLEGQGQRELARTLFGLETISAGEIHIDGKRIKLTHPRHAIDAGVVFISDDRKGEGLALILGVRENIALPNLRDLTRNWLTRPAAEADHIRALVERFDVKTPSIEQPVQFLSGGNQQKAVLAKWMMRQPRVLIFVEPTRGIDVGAKMEIYNLMHELAQQGAAILMVSSDLLELLGMSSRVLVMQDGLITAELPGDSATEERVMMAATGVVNS